MSLFETVRLSVSVSLRNLYNSLSSIKESLKINDIQTPRFENGFFVIGHRYLCKNKTVIFY